MPPPKAKFHSKTAKVKTNELPKPNKSNNNVPSTSTEANSSSSGVELPENFQVECQFALELCWVIHKLESSINSGKLNEKQIEATEKTIKVLKSPNQPLIKKRQVMRNTFGDYRAKMLEEEKKHSLSPKQIKFVASNKKEEKNKSYFIKKSVFMESEDKNFKFNFEVNPDLGDIKEKNDSQSEKEVEDNKKLDENTEFKFISSGNSFKFNFNIENNELKI